jgi:hypothetical protein
MDKSNGMKESVQKITVWIKKHPWAATAIGVVIVVIGYFVVKSSGGNPEGESLGLDATPSEGESISDPLAALGGGSGASLANLGSAAQLMPTVTAAQPAQETESIVDSFPSFDGGGDLGTFDMGIASGYDSAYSASVGGLISTPTSAASVLNQTATRSGAKVSSLSKPTATAAATPQKVTATAKTVTPAKTATQSFTSALLKPVTQAYRSSVVATLTPKATTPLKTPVRPIAKPTPAKPLTQVYKSSTVATLTPKKTTSRPPSPGPGYTWNGSRWIAPAAPRRGGR